jgi:hypothetical protein
MQTDTRDHFGYLICVGQLEISLINGSLELGLHLEFLVFLCKFVELHQV